MIDLRLFSVTEHLNHLHASNVGTKNPASLLKMESRIALIVLTKRTPEL